MFFFLSIPVSMRKRWRRDGGFFCWFWGGEVWRWLRREDDDIEGLGLSLKHREGFCFSFICLSGWGKVHTSENSPSNQISTCVIQSRFLLDAFWSKVKIICSAAMTQIDRCHFDKILSFIYYTWILVAKINK